MRIVDSCEGEVWETIFRFIRQPRQGRLPSADATHKEDRIFSRIRLRSIIAWCSLTTSRCDAARGFPSAARRVSLGAH